MLHKPFVREAINNAWNSNLQSTNNYVASRLRLCRKALSKWKNENQLNSKDRISKLQADLEDEESLISPSFGRMDFLKRSLVRAYKDEENFWKQKNKDVWILHGDSNTKVFHEAVKASRSRNEIGKLLDKNGFYQRSEASKGQVAI